MEGLTRSQRKRAAILEAAAREFELRGFRDTSMDRIAEQAEVSKRTVYNHFETKDALFHAIVTDMVEELSAVARDGFDADKELRSQLLALVDRVGDVFLGERAIRMTRTLIAEAARSPELISQIFAEEMGEDAILVWVQQAADAGALRLEDAAAAARQLSALLKGQLFWPRVLGVEGLMGDVDRSQVQTAAVDMFLRSYAIS